MDNTAKVRENDNFNFSNDENDFRRGNKRKRKLYNKKDDNKNGKIRVVKLNKYYKKKKFKP